MATDGYVSHQQQKWETYLAEHQIEKIFRDMTSDIITKQPQDSIQHMIEWLHKFREAKTKPKKNDKKEEEEGPPARRRVVGLRLRRFLGGRPALRRRQAVEDATGTIAAPRLSLRRTGRRRPSRRRRTKNRS